MAIFADMDKKIAAEFIFSDSFSGITDPRLAGRIVHLVCLGGKGSFAYNGREVSVRGNDAVVIAHPELVGDIRCDGEPNILFLAVPVKFIYNLLPANHYGVGGGISLFDDPVIPLSPGDAARLHADICRIRERAEDKHHMFYDELVGSLVLTMIYDLFDFHAKLHEGVAVSHRTAHIVRRLLSLLEAGRCRYHRSVSYYAAQLNVTPKYLSETVRRNTGSSVSLLIDRHTVPMIADYLNNSDMSLTQICEEMNFSSLSYFSRYVQKHLGMSPAKYRAAHSPLAKKTQTYEY